MKKFAAVSLVALLIGSLAGPVSASNIAETEPNNVFAQANKLSATSTNPGNAVGTISSASDVDFFYIWPQGGQPYTITLTQIPSDADYDLAVYSAAGNLIAASGNYGTTQESVTVSPIAYQNCYIKVYPKNGGFNTTKFYSLSAIHN